MAISADMVDYIRTMVKGDHVENDRVEARLDAQGWDGFPILLGAVFYFAVNRHFPQGASDGDIMRFVTEMRSTATAGGPETDANSAEALIRAALDPSVDTDVDPKMAGRVQGLTILHILGHGRATNEEIDALLVEATELANQL